MALQIGTDFGKQANQVGSGKLTGQVGLGKLASQDEKVANQEEVSTEKPNPPVMTLLDSLSDNEFESVKKVDTVDTVV
ncbi:MAG: hypothetical protein LBC64_04510 [Fibromonadaceae bacterium]|jgi:hypothetical protein|nr:hypothetical protein [Fibromonadaceae bacterium]